MLIGGVLCLIIDNEPGDQHAKLLDMGNPDLVFAQGVTLHDSSDHEAVSNGDGGWIIRKCATALGGDVSLTFSPNSTTFRLTCPVQIYATEQLISNFHLPVNTIVYFVDDSNIQRKLFPPQLATSLNIRKDNIIVRGADEAEIRSWPGELRNLMQKQPESQCLLICDENLDYATNGVIESMSGSAQVQQLRDELKEQKLEWNLLALMRSGNDNKEDVATYLSRAHGLLSKSVAMPQDVLAQVALAWCNRFGLPTLQRQGDLDCSIQEDEFELVISEVNLTMGMLNGPVLEEGWSALWKQLHQAKGTWQLLAGMHPSAALAECFQQAIDEVNKLRGAYQASYLTHGFPALKHTLIQLIEVCVKEKAC